MSKKEKISLDKIAAEIRDVSIPELMNTDYLPYAYYTIQDRALVAESGLKPVQERILLSLWRNGLRANKPTMKAGTVYAHTMGNYHPHGQASISDAGAKFGQSFNFRVPIIDVQGQVGFEYGDSPASERYYEIRLNKAGEELVKDIDNNAVDTVRNFADSEDMPVQMPIKWPFALVNGGEGIAVGYSTYLIPHNPTETMDAVIGRIKGKINNVEDLLKVMKGPDVPTGGTLLGLDGVKDYFETGVGKFFIRGKYEIKPLPRGRHQIVFFEIPYKVSNTQIIAAINKAKNNGKLKGVTEAKNLSSRSRGTHLSISVKAGENPNLILEELFKLTPLEQGYNIRNTILIDKKPAVASIMDMIDSFIDFRKETFIRKSTFELEKLKTEFTRLSGLITVLVDIDKVISIIRESDDDSIASQELQKVFKITEEQASFVLQLRLKSLTKADKNELALRVENLKKEIDYLEDILTNENSLINAIIKDLEETKKVIVDDRRTTITSVTTTDLAEQEKALKKQEKTLARDVECFIYVLSNGSIIKTLEQLTDYHVPIKFELQTTSKSDFAVMLSDGTFKTINADNISLNSEFALSQLVGKVDIVGLIPLDLNTYKGILFVTANGGVNIIDGKIKEPLVKLADDNSLIFAKPLTEDDFNKHLYIIASDGMLAKFPVNSIRVSKSGAGVVAGMKYKEKSVVAQLGDDYAYVLTVSNNTIKLTEAEIIPATSRGVKGSLLHKLDKDDNIVNMVIHSDLKIKLDNGDYLELPNSTLRAKKGSTLPSEQNLFIGY